MNRFGGRESLFVLVICVSTGWATVSAGAVRQAPATVRDGVDMTNLAFVGYMRGGPACGIGTDYESLATFSPRGRRFIVVVRKGDLKRGANRYTMLLWKLGTSGPRGPSPILTMDSSTYYPGIDPGTVTWAQNGGSVTFVGARGAGHQEIYQFNLASKTLRVLTHQKTSVISFSTDEAGTEWAYGAVGAGRSLWSRGTMAHGLPVTSQSLMSVLFGEVREPWAMTFSTLWVSDRQGAHRIRPMPGSHFSFDQGGLDGRIISMSPNGRYVIVPETVPNHNIPEAWHRYADPEVEMQFAALQVAERHKTEEFFPFSRLILVNVRTGHSRILLNAPVPGGVIRPVVWAPNSQSVIISQILMPIEAGAHDVGSSGSIRKTIEVNIRTGKITPIGPRCETAVAWDGSGLECKSEIFSYDTALKRAENRRGGGSSALMTVCPAPIESRFQKADGGRWRASSRGKAPELDVFLREGLNKAPELYYRQRNETHAKLLLNLNPQFRRIALSRERLVTWEWSKGHPITAGLYYPPNYQPGRRYPLVIQTHGFDPSLFGFWGDFPTSDAAQPLAAHGIFVLQVDDTDGKLLENRKIGQLEEVRRAVKIYQSAISYLSAMGLIDPRRVGIIGFSHTCFFVDWALTHDPHLFAAASVTEGGDGSPMEDMLSLKNSVYDKSLYGGPPFGKTLKNWVKRAPIFHVNRVRTPLLLVIPHHVIALYEWEWLHGLRELKRPVQMLVLDGRINDEHIMQVPMSIAVASGESVDWFDFWLNGQEPRGSATRKEYRHWERLCAEQKRENPGRPVFCVTRRPQRAANGHDRPVNSVRRKLVQPRLARQIVHDARRRDGEKGLIRSQVAF